MVDGMKPIGTNISRGTAHPDRVDLRGGRQSADDDWNVVAAAIRINNVGKQKGSAIVLVDAAKKLAANQRVQFRIFVDRVVDTNEQTIRFQLGEMGLEIQARLFRGWQLRVAHATMIRTRGIPEINAPQRMIEGHGEV
jgi:hypothetical protein